MPTAAGNFVVVGDELVASGSCNGVEDVLGEQSQPLFVRHLPGGEWHVLRWIGGYGSAVLAAEGNLLAIGEPSSSGTMRVTVLNLVTRSVLGQFHAPHGRVGSPRRAVRSGSLWQGGGDSGIAGHPTKQLEWLKTDRVIDNSGRVGDLCYRIDEALQGAA